MERYIALEKYKARGATDICPIKREWCNTACNKCVECSSEKGTSRKEYPQPERSYSDCWSWCDECTRCEAAAVSDRSYNDPYNYILQPRSLAQTPALAKQFCDNICGVNMCKPYRQRQQGYQECKRQGAEGCEKSWGCPNPNGLQFGYVAPIDPMFTDCKPCWEKPFKM